MATIQQKTKVLQKLIEQGVKTEKELQALDMSVILDISNITIPEIKLIAKVQKATKEGRLYSFLGNDEE